MAFALSGFQSLGVMGTPTGTAGSRRAKHTYVSADTPAVVEAASYFNSVWQRLKEGDHIDASLQIGSGNARRRDYVVLTSSASGVTIARQQDEDVTGQGAVAVVATSDGLTTGLILDTYSFVSADNGGSTSNIITLPAPSAATINREIVIQTANAMNLKVDSGAAYTINNVNCGSGSAKAALAATRTYIVRQISATAYILQGFTNLGAVDTPIVPA